MLRNVVIVFIVFVRVLIFSMSYFVFWDSNWKFFSFGFLKLSCVSCFIFFIFEFSFSILLKVNMVFVVDDVFNRVFIKLVFYLEDRKLEMFLII